MSFHDLCTKERQDPKVVWPASGIPNLWALGGGLGMGDEGVPIAPPRGDGLKNVVFGWRRAT